MLFITNREPKGSSRTRINRSIQFDLNKNSPSNSVFYCERHGTDDYSEIGSKELMLRLKNAPAKQLVFYIHGFSNLPEPDIFPRAQKLQELFDLKEPNLVQVVPIIWPCDNDIGMVKDYWDDQKSADSSAFSFSRVLEKFIAWRNIDHDDSCLKRMNVLAHSMGNRVLRQTLAAWNKYDLSSGVPLLFRNSFMLAADVVNETLERGQAGEVISHASRNVVVYHASDDLALRASKASNLKNKIASRRLGHTGPESMTRIHNNVYAIDCDDLNNGYDLPKGHSYFLCNPDGQAGSVFNHIFDAVKTGRVTTSDNHDRRNILVA